MNAETKVGLLVFATLAVLVVTFMWVLNVQLTGKTNVYRTYFAHVGGLDDGNVVRFGGRRAGSVQDVRPWTGDMTKTEVIFQLRSELPVTEDTLATIESLSVLGQNYLEIRPGSIEAPRIPPGGIVPSSEPVSLTDLSQRITEVADGAVHLMSRIDSTMTTVATDLGAVLRNLEALSNEDNQRNLARTLESTADLIESQGTKIDDITTQIATTLDSIDALSREARLVAQSADTAVQNVNRTVEETREPIKDTLENAENALAEAQSLLEEVRFLLATNDRGITETIDNFRRASAEIEALASELRQRPWTLIRSRPKPDRAVPPTSGSGTTGR